jgi:hypothetical protein
MKHSYALGRNARLFDCKAKQVQGIYQKGFYCETLSVHSENSTTVHQVTKQLQKRTKSKQLAVKRIMETFVKKIYRETGSSIRKVVTGSEVHIRTSPWKRHSTKCYTVVTNVSYVMNRKWK